ncbi:hypothetical protein SSYRP_v1c08340 [Spiroplasma syrphidicola EA-1]|uniref:Transmembrane protein n=1 Tax=Spiroplasma syrphidicola EA-1 TaxID=1276229 RepID=R4U708_9MOLU|nr:hypothetical protein [Spiroplasma syrphidicola]AGM26423.1 hypothetical protein SSYRP_v1c08340 [Spiroplasma syrphidicola EA-1]
MTKEKKQRSLLGTQYFVMMIFWLILTAVIITFLILFLNERQNVNEKYGVTQKLADIANGTTTGQDAQAVYQMLMNIKYPLIDFSLLSFTFFAASTTQISDWGAAWAQRETSINLAYSYLFITAVIAIIGLCYYIVINIKIFRYRSFQWRYGLATNYPNDLPIFNTKIYLTFITNLTIIFSFFNFLTTIIALAYGAFLVLVSYFFWYILKNRTEVLVPHKWWKASNFAFFTTVLVIQNGYTLIKSIFSAKFGVDLDLILQIIIPIGTITVIIAVFIKNLLSTKVSAVRNAIKTIGGKVATFRIFYYTQQEKSLEDFAFVSQLPPLIKKPLSTKAINTKQALELMDTLEDGAKFIEQHFKKPKETNYMLYHLFNEIVDVAEIDEIKSNILKVEAKKNKGTINK